MPEVPGVPIPLVPDDPDVPDEPFVNETTPILPNILKTSVGDGAGCADVKVNVVPEIV